MATKETVKVNVGILPSDSNIDLELNLFQNCSMKSVEWQNEIKSKLMAIGGFKKEDIELDWYFKPKISAYNELFKDFANSGHKYRLIASVKSDKFKNTLLENNQAEKEEYPVQNRVSYTKVQAGSISKGIQQVNTVLKQNKDLDLVAVDSLKEKLNSLIGKLNLPENTEQSLQGLIGDVITRLSSNEGHKLVTKTDTKNDETTSANEM